MPGQNNTNSTPSPFEISTTSKSKKGGNKGIIVAVLIVVFLLLAVVAGVLLVRQNQNVAEKAAPATTEKCATGFSTTHVSVCKKNCANQEISADLYWINATYGTNCGTGTDGLPKNICDYDECARLAATAKPTAKPTATATSRATATATSTARSSTTPTPTATSTSSTGQTPTPTATATATSSSNQTATPTATAASTTTAQTTSKPIPVTGTDWPTVVGAGVGVFVIIGSILLAL